MQHFSSVGPILSIWLTYKIFFGEVSHKSLTALYPVPNRASYRWKHCRLHQFHFQKQKQTWKFGSRILSFLELHNAALWEEKVLYITHSHTLNMTLWKSEKEKGARFSGINQFPPPPPFSPLTVLEQWSLFITVSPRQDHDLLCPPTEYSFALICFYPLMFLFLVYFKYQIHTSFNFLTHQ